ncbi:MAG: hypothetical protein Q7R33_06055 [Nitrosarchaeum sp.]|nr:hypothetical protein [Nitrosarchaeum sp.]
MNQKIPISTKKQIENLTLNADDIEALLDATSITDDIVDFLVNKYSSKFAEDSFSRVNDLLNLVDLTKYDEQLITSSITEAAKRSFCSLMMSGKLSRQDIIFYIKYELATNDDILQMMTNYPQADLAEITLRWRPQLFETILKSFCGPLKITQSMIDSAKRRYLHQEKFKFLV